MNKKELKLLIQEVVSECFQEMAQNDAVTEGNKNLPKIRKGPGRDLQGSMNLTQRVHGKGKKFGYDRNREKRKWKAGAIDEGEWGDQASYIRSQGDYPEIYDQPEDPPVPAKRLPLDKKRLSEPNVKRAIGFISKMNNSQWRPLLTRATRRYELFSDDGKDSDKTTLAMALQYIDENPTHFSGKKVAEMTTTGAVQGYMTPKAFSKKTVREEEQPEPYDQDTGQVAPGPRQRPEDWSPGDEPIQQWKPLSHGFFEIPGALARKLGGGTLPPHGRERLVKAPSGFKTKLGFVWLARTSSNGKLVWSIRDSGNWKLDNGRAVSRGEDLVP